MGPRAAAPQDPLDKSVLPPGFVDDERDRIAKIQAAVAATHWNPQAPLKGNRLNDPSR